MSPKTALAFLATIFAISSGVAALPVEKEKFHLHEFTSATWNLASQPGRWDQVLSLLATGIDVLVLQETGDTQDIAGQLTTTRNDLPIRRLERSGFYADSRVFEYIWTAGDETFYFYYFNPNSPSQPADQQTLAIVTRQRARHIIVSTEDRPFLGLLVGNGLFINHANSAAAARADEAVLLDQVQRFSNRYYSAPTWLVLGDFEQTPEQLAPVLPTPPQFKYIHILRAGESTSGQAELDYGVAGGYNFKADIVAIPVKVVENDFSTHRPVRFN